MTIRKARRKNTEKPFHEAVTDLLFSAMANHENFVLAYETDSETGTQEVHVMCGHLITPEIAVEIKNQCELQQNEGSRHITRKLN